MQLMSRLFGFVLHLQIMDIYIYIYITHPDGFTSDTGTFVMITTLLLLLLLLV